MYRNRRGQFSKKPRVYRLGIKALAIPLLGICALHISIGVAKAIDAVEPEPIVVELPEHQGIEVEFITKINWTEDKIVEAIKDAFPDAPIMTKVAWCESRYQPDAFNPTNGSNDQGLFQISQKHHQIAYGDRDMFDVEENIKFARELYDKQGLAPWKWSKHCWGN